MNMITHEESPPDFNARAPVVLTTITALLQRFSPEKRQNRLHVTFEHTEVISAGGLAIFLGQVLKALHSNSVLQVSVEAAKDVKGNETAVALLMAIAGERLHTDMLTCAAPECNNWEWISTGGVLNVMFIIPQDKSQRDALPRQVRTRLMKILSFTDNDSAAMLTLQIFTEMIKNTIDHSEGSAILGVEINTERKRVERFAYCEGSRGFCRTLRMALKVAGISSHLVRNGSISDLIHWATRPGNSTLKKNGKNLGLGLSVIAECARAADFSLLMLDAKSMISFDQIKSEMSHEELRARMVHSGSQPCFSFVGIRND